MADFMICMGTERRRVKESGDTEGCRWRRTEGMEEEARGWSEKKDWRGVREDREKSVSSELQAKPQRNFSAVLGLTV